MNPTKHNHEDPAHLSDIEARCCCCNARWTPVPFPGSGCEMIHAEGCAYLADTDDRLDD